MGKMKLDLEEGEGRWKALVIPIVLFLLFLLAFAIRSVFYFPPATEPVDEYGDEGYLLSGNDPNYHKRTVDYVQDTHTHLVWDDMLDYPKGAPNPNPPLYAWSIALMGYLVSPFFGGDIHTATWYVMEFAAAFWAALTVFPVYVFTRDMFGKKPGIFAAFFIAVMAANVERTPVGFSDHDAFVIFFVVLAFLFLMRAMRMLNNRKYIENWFSSRDVALGVRDLLSENKKAFLYATLSAISIGAVALSWKGVAYVYAIIFVYYVFHLSVNKMKREESLGIAMVIMFTMGLSMLLAFPYYNIKYFTSWIESSFFILVAMAILSILLVPTRDLPWLLVVPTIVVLLVGGLYALQWLFPSITETLFALQGYFLKTKLYETIAEAQAPDFSRMVFSYGVITFYLTLLGAAWAAYRLPKEKWRNDYIVTVIWALVSIYMAMTAVRFMYNATPIFAIFAGWITYKLVQWTGFDEMLKTYRGLKSERLYAIKKSVKPRHVLTVLFVAFLIVWPNFWYGFDAGIPYEKKGEVDKEIYETLPGPLKPDQETYDQTGQWWLGAFGTAYPSDYWVDGMFWLADQDQDEIPVDRPAFISWWDYGHWAVHMGQHPAAADNFQNGFQWAGNYISAQNESVAIALTTSKLIEGNIRKDNDVVLDILERYVGEERREDYLDYFYNPLKYKDEVLDNPHIYGPHVSKRIDRNNIKYLMMSRMLIMELGKEEMVNLLHDLETETGESMRYFAVDTRLMPLGPRNTGIFYAPIKLSDQNINDFLVVYAIGNDGSRTNVNDQKAMEKKYKDTGYKVQGYEIEYSEMFYNSMFYKAYIGWKPTDAEINEPGIPTVSRPADVGRRQLKIQSLPPIQGWGMNHFRLDYKTTYWNPNKTDPSAHPGKWEVIPQETVEEKKEMAMNEDPEVASQSGILDNIYRPLYGGVFFLKYYDGAYINGTISLEDGTPLEGARVTVYDDMDLPSPSWPGAPHGYTHTDENGHYSILAPYGNVTVRVSSGGTSAGGEQRINDLLMQSEKRILNQSRINITDNQAMRIKEDRDGDGIWDFNIRHDVKLNYSTVEGKAYWDLDNDKEFDEAKGDTVLSGRVMLSNSSYNWNRTVEISENGSFVFDKVIPDDYILEYLPSPDEDFEVEPLSVQPDEDKEHDLAIQPGSLNGTIVDTEENPLPAIDLVVQGRGMNVSYETSTDENGTYQLGTVLPGNYSLSVDDVRYTAREIIVGIVNGTNTTRNMTLSKTVRVEGDARLPDGDPVHGTVMVFRNTVDDDLSRNIRIGGDGSFNDHLPPGNYTVNARVILDGETYTYMRQMELTDDIELDINFTRSWLVNGTVYEDLNDNNAYDPPIESNESGSGAPSSGPGAPPEGDITLNEGQPDMIVEFDDPEGNNISMMDNSDGYYETYLASDRYTAYVHSSPTTDDNFTALTPLTVDSDTEFNIQIEEGTSFKGSIFHDIDRNGIQDDEEALDRARMIFQDGENTLVRYCNSTGAFSLLLPNNEYDITVEYPGYEPFMDTVDISGGSVHRNFILGPENITINGTVGYDQNEDGQISDDEGLSLSIYLEPEDPDEETVQVESNESGVFTTEVFPQNYTIVVDHRTTLESGEVRFMYEGPLHLSIGDEIMRTEIPLALHHKVHGDIFFDENENGILNSGERRTPVLTLTDTAGEEYEADVTPEGFVVWLREGTYDYYAHMGEAGAETDQIAVLDRVKVTKETQRILEMKPAIRASGVVFFDQNENGEVDTGEQERDVEVAFSRIRGEESSGTVTTETNDVGEYNIYLPWGQNYSIEVDLEEERTLLGDDFTVRFTYFDTVSMGEDENFVMDLEVDKALKVSGNVTYESPEGFVPLDGAEVIFDGFSTLSDDDGNYSLFVRPGEYDPEVEIDGFELPESVFGNRTVDPSSTEQNFILDPLNVTVRGYVYADHNDNDRPDPVTEGEKVTVEFIAADDRAVNATMISDNDGMYVVDLEPGNYFVWAHKAIGPRNYVLFDHFPVDASGADLVTDLEMGLGLTLQGEIKLVDTDGDEVTPKGTNITVYNNDTGVSREFEVTTRQYAYHLPAGEYNLTSHFINQEYGMDMEYELEENLELDRRMKTDLIFEKDRKFYLEFGWDEDERLLLEQNESVVYNLTVENVGNEPGRFDIDAIGPTGWKAETSIEEIFLDINGSSSFTVTINVSKEAKAGGNRITVRGMSQDLEEFSNTTSVFVDVVQIYNISLGSSDKDPTYDRDGYHYHVSVENMGNGMDEVILEVITPFPGWNITLEDTTLPVSKGQTKDVEVLLVPQDPKNMTGREMTVKVEALSEGGEKDRYDLFVTFPDVTGDLEVTGPGVKEKKEEPSPSPIPSFDAVLLGMAVVVVVVLIDRRKRRRRGGDGP